MKKLALFATLILSACTIEDVPTGATSTSTSFGSGGFESSGSTTEAVEFEHNPERSCVAPEETPPSITELAAEADVSESCAPKFCAQFSAGCKCVCSSIWPHGGSLECCMHATDTWAPNQNGCGAGSVYAACKNKVDPTRPDVPPTSCAGNNFVCPSGYAPYPTTPSDVPGCGETCGGYCQGSGVETCAASGTCDGGSGHWL